MVAPSPTVSISEIAQRLTRALGCTVTPEQVSKQIAANAIQLRQMHAKAVEAERRGLPYRGFSTAYLDAKATAYENPQP